jgi:transposase
LNIKVEDTVTEGSSKDDYFIIAIDSTGIKITNRGQWLKDKWNIRKGYLKIHIAVDTKSKKILSVKVTDEHVHDSKVLPKLVDNIIKSKDMRIDKVFADGAYISNDVFRCLADNGVLPCIKVRRNANINKKTNNTFRNLSVIYQNNDLQRWKDSVSYGKRWIAETVFSCIKRTFGEFVYSVRLENMIQEMMLKASLYNKFTYF